MSRYLSLPRRDWRPLFDRYGAQLSAALRTPAGQQTLKPMQVAGLLEVGLYRGVVVVGRVGVGKTHFLGLAPRMARAQRPLLCFPGGSRKGLLDHLAEISTQWQLPPHVEFMSYTEVSNLPRKGRHLRDLFGGKGPDFIGCDEVHALRNLGGRGRGGMGAGSALAIQFHDWAVENPACMFAFATATLDVTGLLDFFHIFDWALRQRSPIPRNAAEAQVWSEVLDDGDQTKASWIASDLGMPADATVDELRAAFKARVHTTPGVIIDDSPFEGVPLTVTEAVLPPDPQAEPHFDRLRTLWQRPDGLDVAADEDGSLAEAEEREPDRVQDGSIWSIARRMGRGLCYVYDPLPPQEWRDKRAAYYKWVRRAVRAGRFLTEGVARAWAREHGQPEYLAWEEIRPTYAPTGKTLWLSTAALEFAEQWGRATPGIIWTEDPAWGLELSRRTGWRYFGSRGRSQDGTHITDRKAEPGTRSAIASGRACGASLNLQYQWRRCLLVPPVKSYDFEQRVGRFHREGQTRPVEVTLLFTCREDFIARDKMIASAHRTAKNLYRQKAATNSWPHAEMPEHGSAYGNVCSI